MLKLVEGSVGGGGGEGKGNALLVLSGAWLVRTEHLEQFIVGMLKRCDQKNLTMRDERFIAFSPIFQVLTKDLFIIYDRRLLYIKIYKYKVYGTFKTE